MATASYLPGKHQLGEEDTEREREMDAGRKIEGR